MARRLLSKLIGTNSKVSKVDQGMNSSDWSGCGLQQYMVLASEPQYVPVARGQYSGTSE